jgi:hypothetical protein
VYFAAEGPTGRQHDFLTVSLDDGRATRLLHFAGERNSWSLGLVDLKAGEEVADEIDLSAWAADPVNDADPLAPGEYALTATYRVAQPEAWSGSITAGPIRVVVAPLSPGFRLRRFGL